jgi:hypothetical protein
VGARNHRQGPAKRFANGNQRKRRSVKTFSSMVTPIVKATKEITVISVCTSKPLPGVLE